jgi:hypothetical protein
MFKVSPASLQTFIDTPNSILVDRVQYSTVRIANVFCDGRVFHEVTETFDSPLFRRNYSKAGRLRLTSDCFKSLSVIHFKSTNFESDPCKLAN